MRIFVICCLAALAFLASAEETPENVAENDELIPGGCNPVHCMIRCGQKNQRGVCRVKKCVCVKYFAVEDPQTSPEYLVAVDQPLEHENEPMAARCDPVRCNQTCRKANLPGVCNKRTNNCQCILGLSGDDSELEVADDQQLDTGLERGIIHHCNAVLCRKSCHDKGGKGGHCKRSTCVCPPKFFDLTETLTDLLTIYPEEAGNERGIIHHCNPVLCRKSCHDKGGKGGHCRRKQCICPPKFYDFTDTSADHISSISDDTVSEDDPSTDQIISTPGGSVSALRWPSCDPPLCRSHCKKRKYKKGKCAEGTCKCYKQF